MELKIKRRRVEIKDHDLTVSFYTVKELPNVVLFGTDSAGIGIIVSPSYRDEKESHYLEAGGIAAINLQNTLPYVEINDYDIKILIDVHKRCVLTEDVDTEVSDDYLTDDDEFYAFGVDINTEYDTVMRILTRIIKGDSNAS